MFPVFVFAAIIFQNQLPIHFGVNYCAGYCVVNMFTLTCTVKQVISIDNAARV